jgi:hypothetical protein
MAWCAVKGVYIQWAEVPTRQLLLQPVAIGAVVEVTKQLKPSMYGSRRRLGEHAGRNVSER